MLIQPKRNLTPIEKYSVEDKKASPKISIFVTITLSWYNKQKKNNLIKANTLNNTDYQYINKASTAYGI